MERSCITKKNRYATQYLAEDVLIELWTKNEYHQGHAPIAVYRCDDCGDFHLTSKGPMNPRLAEAIRSKGMSLAKEANRWVDKLKGKSR